MRVVLAAIEEAGVRSGLWREENARLVSEGVYESDLDPSQILFQAFLRFSKPTTHLCLLLHGQGIVRHVAVVVVMLMVEAVGDICVLGL